MAGLGIEYPPPIEDVPIFDPLLFLEADFALTASAGDARYLRFPTAQGKETMQDMDVNGLGTFFNGITMNGAVGDNLTNNQNIIMNGTALTNYIQFPDGTQQFTASTGGGGLEGQYVVAVGLTNPQLILAPTQGTTFDINVPVGTRITKITIVGGGGQAGANFLDGDTMYAGGTGGGGSYAQFNLDLTAYTASIPATVLLQYKFTNGGAGVGLTGLLFWSPAAIALFPELSNNGGNLTFAFGGGVGGNASLGTGGNAGTSGNAGLSVQAGLLTQGNDGSAGVKTTAGFSYSTTNLTVRGGNNALASIGLSPASGLGAGALGQGWTFAPSTTPVAGSQGQGAIYLEFFT
jgi:hypothetical protein